MSTHSRADGVIGGRLPDSAYAAHFGDVKTPLDGHEAVVAADRCYFCYDAPCVTACPTAIDIPLFIRQISTGTPEAAAQTILDQNIFGGMCARVCPTDTLCEGACVREAAEGKPVEIGRLQRYATDTLMAEDRHPYTRAAPSGRKVAVIGAGPAGLACAHRLAVRGHDVVVFDARAKPGGLNEYGIAAYKSTGDFAQREVAWLLQIGGIEIRPESRLGREVSLEALRSDYDAVFLGMGLAGVNALRLEGEAQDHVHDAVDFIAGLRQAPHKAHIPVGRDVVVIGGGMTAVDAAVQSKLLGAEHVTMVYRGLPDRLSASGYEQMHAKSKGVRVLTGLSPKRVLGTGPVEAVEFFYTDDPDKGLTLRADQVFKAIGQRLDETPGGLRFSGGKIDVTGNGRTSLDGVWAGGDCVAPGDDLTVTAVAQGRDAAEDIHIHLTRAPAVAAE